MQNDNVFEGWRAANTAIIRLSTEKKTKSSPWKIKWIW
jgi:hypothetical protein